jgi:hypothetical protein
MFGKLRRPRANDKPANTTTFAGLPQKEPRIPEALYMRSFTHHTGKKAAITRLHKEKADFNNRAPVSLAQAPDAERIARAAADAPSTSSVIFPPAMPDPQ